MTTPTPYERLLAEELPTGTFGGPVPDEPHPTTKAQAARLAEAVADAYRPRTRHLTAVPDAATSEDAA